MPTLSPDDQAKVDHFDKANDFESKRFQASKHADQILQELEVSAAELVNERDLSTDLKGEVEAVQQSYRDLFKTFGTGIKQLRADLAKRRTVLTGAETAWAA